MMRLSIIVVNWNCIAFTEQCIASIVENLRGITYEIIVVDNASGDAPCRSLAASYPALKLILSKVNIGFGRANNLAVRSSTGVNLLFINPDTVVLGDAIHRMLHHLDSCPDAGAIGSRLLNPDGSVQISCVQRFPTISNQLLALKWLQIKYPSLSLWGKQVLYGKESGLTHEVDVVSGAAILVKRGIFQEVGGFHPEYFMFAEEVELCHAIRRLGRKVLYTSDAHIVHFGGQSTKCCTNSFADIMMCDSVYRFFKRTRGAPYANLYRAGLMVSGLVRLTLLTFATAAFLIQGNAEQNLDRERAKSKWRGLLQWSLGRETQTADLP